jgi:putative transposase
MHSTGSDDNPYSEALFRTLKYHPTFPMHSKFETITEARRWCEKFSNWYNHIHLHSALKFITPNQRHTGEDAVIMKKRDLVYQLARAQNPERWSGETRNWTLPGAVTLNPDRKLNLQLAEKERLDGAVSGSRQAADAVRQQG